MDSISIQSALHDRYGYETEFDPFAWNETLDSLLKHRSIREYSDKALPEHTLETLIAAAQSAPTSSNLQTWSVVAVEDQARKDRLAHWASNQKQVSQCPLLLVWLADLSRLTRAAQQRDMPHEALRYTEMFLMASIDATLAAQNAVVAAESLGLGTVYIGSMRNHPLEVARELKLPKRVFPVFGLCVGWPKEDHTVEVKKRLPQAAVLHRESYSIEHEEEALEGYNQRMSEFYRQQQMNVQGDWSAHSSRRVAGPQTLSGRDVLRQSIEEQGFELL
jgi:nitroreductase